jgi:hypothetical protein
MPALTPIQARLRWCHQTQSYSTVRLFQNQTLLSPVINEGKRCIAGRCMAWRWDNPAETEGFCGLAGKP